MTAKILIHEPILSRCERAYIDPLRTILVYDGKHSHVLTLKEFQILSVFLASPNYTASREEFDKSIWRGVKITQHTLDVHIYNLRKKIAAVGANVLYKPPNCFALVLENEERNSDFQMP